MFPKWKRSSGSWNSAHSHPCAIGKCGPIYTLLLHVLTLDSGILLLDCSQRAREPNSPIISLDHLSVESSLISQTVLQISLYIAELTEQEIHARSSPFLLHVMYRVAMLYLKASRTAPSESLTDKLQLIKQGLEILGRRYHVARMCLYPSFLHYVLTKCIDSYLSLLSRQEIMQAMQ